MTLAELKTALEGTGLPVAYREFISTVENPAPDPPFICIQFANSDDVMADNQNYKGIGNYDVELYAELKDQTTEGLVEAVLRTNRLAWRKSEYYIETENFNQVVYEIQLIGG